MTIAVEAVDPPREGVDAVRVTTESATGDQREYLLTIGDEPVGDSYVVCGKRTDAAAPDEPAGGGPSRAAWAAAREHFAEDGWEVFRA